ncbi:aldose 1-epimerase-like isoform X2 [Ceratina calcarata]|uniref:Aldose 1-epimerase n=1 Tax=Ceratina calcarata TaxID=156304 RepID=A0AAJ7S5Q0_9HYME|nr:aldose 1-epimerase-like isoform X2 [Ceratina calcarata]
MDVQVSPYSLLPSRNSKKQFQTRHERHYVVRCEIARFFPLFLLSCIMDTSCGKGSITVTKWGSIDCRNIDKYTLKNELDQEVDIITYGATITSIRTPDKEGNIADVVLGFDDISGYATTPDRNPYFGATVGRVANRIKSGQFSLHGKTYMLSKNAGKNTLHGGTKGWSWKVWNASIQKDRLVLTLLSEDGDEGFPGAVVASTTFQLSSDGELRIKMKAYTTKATPINLTNHSYFNLAGHNGSATALYEHLFTLNADRWTVTDEDNIPTGEIQSVSGSPMDLTKPTKLGNVIEKIPGGGFDYNFCVKMPADSCKDAPNERNLVAKVVHPPSGRCLEVFSDQPGVQFYTGNFLPKPDSDGIKGKCGTKYFRHGAFCLETQNYPDAINQKDFPDSVIEPGKLYRHSVIYKFGVAT